MSGDLFGQMLVPVFVVPVALLGGIEVLLGLLLASYAASLIRMLRGERAAKSDSPQGGDGGLVETGPGMFTPSVMPAGMRPDPALGGLGAPAAVTTKLIRAEVHHGRQPGERYHRWRPQMIHLGPYLTDVSLFEPFYAAPMVGMYLN